jgi:hypothetical protein
MDIKRYVRRALKSVLLFFILASLIFVAGFLLGSSSGNPITFKELILTSDISNLVIFLLGFGLVYPFFGYVKQKIHVNHPLEADKQEIIRAFADVRFELLTDENQKMTFHHKSPLVRFIRLYEDRIEIDYAGNPVLLQGLRRDADRLARIVQRIVQKAEEITE